MAPLNLNAQESALLTAWWQSITEAPMVNTTKLAVAGGYNNRNTANTAWYGLRQKLALTNPVVGAPPRKTKAALPVSRRGPTAASATAASATAAPAIPAPAPATSAPATTAAAATAPSGRRQTRAAAAAASGVVPAPAPATAAAPVPTPAPAPATPSSYSSLRPFKHAPLVAPPHPPTQEETDAARVAPPPANRQDMRRRLVALANQMKEVERMKAVEVTREKEGLKKWRAAAWWWWDREGWEVRGAGMGKGGKRCGRK